MGEARGTPGLKVLQALVARRRGEQRPPASITTHGGRAPPTPAGLRRRWGSASVLCDGGQGSALSGLLPRPARCGPCAGTSMETAPVCPRPHLLPGSRLEEAPCRLQIQPARRALPSPTSAPSAIDTFPSPR